MSVPVYKLAILFMCCSAAVCAKQPCEALDDGPFLGTKPTLNMEVFEATQQDLQKYPNSPKYQDELRLFGTIDDTGSSGILLEVMTNFRFFDPRDVFRFQSDAVTGRNILKLVNAVDRDGPTQDIYDDTNIFTYTLKCVPANNKSIEVYYDVRILIKDVNDNYPTFVGAPYTVIVNELSPVGTKILQVSAVDIDFGDNANITYSIVPANVDDVSHLFSVDSLSGDVTLTGAMEYKTMSQGRAYNLDVLAMDGAVASAKSAKTTVHISVTDGDDKGPVFEYQGCFQHEGVCAWPKYTTYANQVKLGEPITMYPVPNKVGHPVTIKARDLDPSMKEVKFSIASTIPPGFESHFSVSTSHSTGPFYIATVKQETAFQLKDGFEIFLKVEEQSGKMRHEIAMIYFMDQKHSTQTEKQGTEPEKTPTKSTVSKDILALIIVVSVLAAFVVCLGLAFLWYVAKHKTSKGKYHPEAQLTANDERATRM